MKPSGQVSRQLLGIVLAALFSNAGCAKDRKPEQAAPQTAKTKEPVAADEEEEEAAPAAAVAAQPTAAATAAADPEPAGLEIDPARMPVEEDFIEEAASRIGKSANLEVELNRIAAEIKKSAAK
jgi:hypothetical protein